MTNGNIVPGASKEGPWRAMAQSMSLFQCLLVELQIDGVDYVTRTNLEWSQNRPMWATFAFGTSRNAYQEGVQKNHEQTNGH